MLILAVLCSGPFVMVALGFDLSSPTLLLSGAGHVDELGAQIKATLLATNLQSMLGWSTCFAAFTFCILAIARYRVGHEPLFPILGVTFLFASTMQAIPNFVWFADSGVSVVLADSNAAQSWIYARAMSGFILASGVGLAIWSFSRDRIFLSCLFLLGLFLVLVPAVFFLSAFETSFGTYSPDSTVKNASLEHAEWAATLFHFLFGGLIFRIFYRRQDDVLVMALLLAVIPQLAADMYLSVSKETLDAYFNSARILTVLAYFIPLGGLFSEVLSSFHQHEDQAQRLSRQSAMFKAQAEDLDQARRRAEEASRAKGEFLANMSHEIRTPLTAIVGYAELMARPQKGKADQEAWIKGLRRGSNHLLALVNDILDLSKIEAGKMGVSKRPQSPVQIVRQVVQLMLPQAKEKMLSLSFELVGRLPREINTDEVRMRQILVNLVSNAIKFTDTGGITIKMRVRRPSAKSAVLEISVQDTGIGIPEDKLAAVFSPFTQVSDENHGGTGLGLDISIRMSRLLGGELSVQSIEGKGSIFCLTLDLGNLENLELADPAELNRFTELSFADAHFEMEDVRFEGRRLLVVDDGRDNQRIIKFLLEEAGAQVDIAENGREAVDKISAHGKDYDLVLMDVQMPIMDGYEATEELRRIGFDSPILAVTAYALARDLKRALSVGCNDFVTKPLVPAQLIRKVEHWLPAREGRERSEAHVFEKDEECRRFEPLLKKFLAGMNDRIEALQGALESEDQAKLFTLVHQIKGSAGSYGYPRVSELAGACQALMRDGEGSVDLNSRVDELINELRTLRNSSLS